ncbi:hypothetical protein ACFP3U_31065 [Kitasatospora misakiensis]|uniref:Uncharacterized protein n=1 Tax=Kitasatospora misakiensis TaxID=67330 RepID=A0ABW0XG09_9ACTN
MAQEKTRKPAARRCTRCHRLTASPVLVGSIAHRCVASVPYAQELVPAG